jgi:hypothetical protein
VLAGCGENLFEGDGGAAEELLERGVGSGELPSRSARNIESENLAAGSGMPPDTSVETKSSSWTMSRVTSCPVRSVRIAATSSKVSAWAAVSGGVGLSNRPSLARMSAAASARSAWVV